MRTDYDYAKRFENVPPEFRYSKQWTDRERLMAIVVMVGMIGDDARMGRYSIEGRPNSVSVQYVAGLPAEELEGVRAELEQWTWEHFNPDPSSIVWPSRSS